MNQSLALSILMQAQDNASSVLSGLANTIKGMLTGSISPMAAISSGLLALGGAAIGFGVAAVSAAASFQQTMTQTQALAGLTSQDAQMAQQAILNMAASIGQTPQQLADGLYYIASAGYSAKDSLTLLDLSARAAAVGNTTTEVTANALTATLGAYGASASQAAGYMDMMVASVSMGKTEFEDYAKVIGTVSVNAQQSGVSFAEATSAFSALTNVMASSKQAKDALDALLQTSSRFDVLDSRARSLGISFDENAYKAMNFQQRLQYLQQTTGGDTQELTKLLGRQNAMAALTALSTNNFAMYDKALQAVKNSHGDLDAAFAKTSATLMQSMARMNAAFQVLLVIVGNALLPAVTGVVNVITNLVSAFAQLLMGAGPIVDFFHSGSVAAYLLGAALGGLALALGIYLATLIPGLIAGLLETAAAMWAVIAPVLVAAAPFILVGIAIAGVIAILVALYNNLSGVRDLVNLVVDACKNLWNVLVAKVTSALQAVWTWIQVYILPALQSLWNWIVNYIVAALQQFNAWLENSVIPALQAFGRWIQNTVVPALQSLYNWIANQIVLALQAFWNWIQTYITPALQAFWNWIQTRIVPALQAFWDMLVNKVNAALQAFWGWIQNSLVPALQSFWNMLVTKVSVALHDIGTWIQNTVVPALQSFWSWIQNFVVPALQNLYNTIATKVTSALQSLWNWIQTQLVPALQNLYNWIIAKIVASWQQFSDLVTNTVVPAIQNLWNWIQTQLVPALQSMAGWVQTTLIPSIQGLATWIQTQLVPAMQNARNWIINTVGSIMQWAGQNDILGKTIQIVWLTVQQLWKVLSTQLGVVFTQLWVTIQTQLVPAWDAFTKAVEPLGRLIQPLLPVLQLLGTMLGVYIVFNIGLLVGAVAGFLTFLGTFIKGLTQAFGGVAQFFAGLYQTVSGLVMFIVDLVTLQFGNLSTDLSNIWNGIGLMFKGIWNIIVGSFTAGILSVTDAVGAFITNTIQFFQNLYNTLVGHSIVPDLMTAIIANFLGMITTVLAQVASFMTGLQTQWNNLLNFFHSMAGNLTLAIESPFLAAASSVASIMQSLASSIGNTVSGIIGNIKSIGGAVSSAGNLTGGLSIPGFANGVSSFAGGLAVVGENGPELAYLPGGTSIIPNNRLSSIGGGGGTTHNYYNVTVNAPAMSRRDADSVATSVAKSLNGRYRTQLGGIATGGSNI